MAVKETTDQTFEQNTAQGVALVDFWATWCGPCRMQSPVVEALSDEMPEVNFFKMDVDQNQETARKFRIMSIPTLMVKKNGEVVYPPSSMQPTSQLPCEKATSLSR